MVTNGWRATRAPLRARGPGSLRRSTSRRWLGFHASVLLIREDTASREEAHTQGRLQAEARAPSRHHVQRQVRVLPDLELRTADVDGAAFDFAQEDIPLADTELLRRVAHGRAAVAAAPRLVEHQRP